MPASKFKVAFIPTSNGGVNYYRLATWCFEMRKYKNVQASLFAFQYALNENHPWQKDIISMPVVRAHINRLCAESDVVIWQPVYYPHTLDFFNEMRQRHGKLTIVETDDCLTDVPHWNEAFHAFGPNSHNRAIALDCMMAADAVIVSTPYLKDTYAPFNSNIHVVENSLDFKGDSSFVGWDKATPKKHRGTRIGWIGGRSHFDDLMLVMPALKEVLTEYPDVRLTLVNSAVKESCDASGVQYPLAGLKNVLIADRSAPINSYARFAAHFGFDIGIAPLVDCVFNRCKSNLRWLEYSAQGIPTVATDISHFSQTIKDGKDGLLVKNNDLTVWKESLMRLIEDDVLRETIGRNAYKRVRKDFNVKRNAAKYLRLLKTLANTTIMGEDAWTYQHSNHSLVA